VPPLTQADPAPAIAVARLSARVVFQIDTILRFSHTSGNYPGQTSTVEIPGERMRDHLLDCDVLVVGGGLAGCNAAIAAAEKGARVVVADKGKIERSGDIGGGVDHFLAFLNTGEAWDTREQYLEYVWKIGKGTADLEVLDEVYCKELPAAIERMQQIGNPLTQADGTFYRTQSMGQPGPYWINFNGKKLKPRLGAAVRKLGCTVLDRVMLTELLTTGGRVTGAVGFHIRKGDFYAITAGATIIATGNTNRLYESPRVNPFNTWLSPFNTGDGQAMAFRAGATLANMEYMRMTILPKGFAAPGFNAFTGLGGRFMNAQGEYYMEKNHPQGNKAPRYDIVFQSLREIKEGRAPLFIDCRGMSDTALAHLQKTLGYDKDTLPDYMQQRMEDLRTKPVEIMISEGMQAGPTEVTGSGVKVGKDSAASVPGMFACGDASDANRCVHGAVAGGYAAGKSAAEFARGHGAPAPDPAELARLKAMIFAPLERSHGMSFTEFENIIRKIMTENAGAERNEKGLLTALEKLAKLRPLISRLKATDLHDLMRVREATSLLEVAEMTTRAALFRKESRNKPYHHRLDYPHTDDTNWCGQVLIRKDGLSGYAVEFKPLTMVIPAAGPASPSRIGSARNGREGGK
jgi:adenylylsulfate reductase subunit A